MGPGLAWARPLAVMLGVRPAGAAARRLAGRPAVRLVGAVAVLRWLPPRRRGRPLGRAIAREGSRINNLRADLRI